MSDEGKILQTGLKLAQEAVEKLPPGTRGALLVQATTTGVQMGIAAKVGNGWTIVGDFDQPWEGKPEGRVRVVKQW